MLLRCHVRCSCLSWRLKGKLRIRPISTSTKPLVHTVHTRDTRIIAATVGVRDVTRAYTSVPKFGKCDIYWRCMSSGHDRDSMCLQVV